MLHVLKQGQYPLPEKLPPIRIDSHGVDFDPSGLRITVDKKRVAEVVVPQLALAISRSATAMSFALQCACQLELTTG